MNAPRSAAQIAPSNIAQAQIWDGDDGAYWAANASHWDRSIAAYHQHFLDAAAINATDRVLDVGSGNGLTTRDAARRATAGFALGIDLSSAMVEVARTLAAREGLANASFVHGDAQVFPFDAGAFDIAISRTGAMFFGDPGAAVRNIATALRPGGRMVLLAWTSPIENEWFVTLASALTPGRRLPPPPLMAPGPFALADPHRTTAILTGAGFADVQHTHLTGEIWFGADADDAHRFILGFLGRLLAETDGATRALALDNLRATVDAHETDRGVVYPSATWLVTASKP